MCVVQLPPGGNPLAVNKYHIICVVFGFTFCVFGLANHYVEVSANCLRSGFFSISAEPTVFCGIFLLFQVLYNTECYPQNLLQFNHNVRVYTLVILPIFKISAWQIRIAVCTVLRLLMMDSPKHVEFFIKIKFRNSASCWLLL